MRSPKDDSQTAQNDVSQGGSPCIEDGQGNQLEEKRVLRAVKTVRYTYTATVRSPTKYTKLSAITYTQKTWCITTQYHYFPLQSQRAHMNTAYLIQWMMFSWHPVCPLTPTRHSLNSEERNTMKKFKLSV